MEHRTERITFRVSPVELRVIEEKAEKANLKVSELVRRATLDKEIVVIEELKDFTKEVRGIGRNINQLTILAHQGKIIYPNIYEIEGKIDDIWQLLNLLIAKTKAKKN
ncbi:hypothetical protein CIW83_02940 [Tissierella sp. P1]|uniref:plasmid mobilization protein n=1 Tax=Tissierella sp. P1 TaxID=1280483 RepID=UPI000BA061F3|nr:plasmid mobilization relaxosome protein MobC [Tissierella sp. P1]OZV13519.1 hypothetical protein CIW83_02940 [Tissierella sp. P1]